MRQSAEVENHMTSCERIFEYANLTDELAYVNALDRSGDDNVANSINNDSAKYVVRHFDKNTHGKQRNK